MQSHVPLPGATFRGETAIFPASMPQTNGPRSMRWGEDRKVCVICLAERRQRLQGPGSQLFRHAQSHNGLNFACWEWQAAYTHPIL